MKRNFRNILFSCICLFAFPFMGFAEQEQPKNVQLLVDLDTGSIRLGEQTDLTFSLQYRVDEGGEKSIHWPTIGDTITSDIEIVNRTKVDTSLPNKKEDPYLFQQNRKYTITSFEEGQHTIPSFEFVVGEDTLKTETMPFKVQTMKVDTSASSVRDIKEIYDVPWSFTAWLKNNWGYVAGGLGLIAALVFLFWYLRRREKKEGEEPAPVPQIPAHEKALRELEKLLQKELWQQGQVKVYHVKISELIRDYIEDRYNINAPEQTTPEILRNIQYTGVTDEARSNLEFVLNLTDMVKFAKEIPTTTDNENAAKFTRAFINLTKKEPAEEEQTAS